MQLKPAAKSEWLIPCEGLRVHMRPVSTPVMVEARYQFRGLAAAEAEAHGLDDVTPQQRHYLMSVAMIYVGALEWDGLADEDAQPLPKPDLSQVKRLLDAEPAIFDTLDAQYCTPLYLLLAEKKGLRVSQSGTSPSAAPNTAKAVTSGSATKTSRAPTTRTRRKARKAD